MSEEGNTNGPSGVSVVAALLPLRGSLTFHLQPTAYAVGCILSPLRGFHCISPRFVTHNTAEKQTAQGLKPEILGDL